MIDIMKTIKVDSKGKKIESGKDKITKHSEVIQKKMENYKKL